MELKALSEMEGEMKKAAAEAGVKSENVTPKVGENSSEAPQSGADSAKPQVWCSEFYFKSSNSSKVEEIV